MIEKVINFGENHPLESVCGEYMEYQVVYINDVVEVPLGETVTLENCDIYLKGNILVNGTLRFVDSNVYFNDVKSPGAIRSIHKYAKMDFDGVLFDGRMGNEHVTDSENLIGQRRFFCIATGETHMQDCELVDCDHFLKVIVPPRLSIVHTWVSNCGAETVSVVYDKASKITCRDFVFHRSTKDGKAEEREPVVVFCEKENEKEWSAVWG